MDHRAQVIKKHLNAVAKQVVGPPIPMRPDEPNMPLETMPGSWTDQTPDHWQFSMMDLFAALYNGVDNLRAYIIRWLVSIGMPMNLARILVINLTFTRETLWEFAYWIIRPQSTNLPENIFRSLIVEILYAINPGPNSTVIDDAIWSTFWYFRDKGIFFFGDLMSAKQRGWTFGQIMDWLKFLIERGSDYNYNWPDTPEQAQEEIDSYKDMESEK